MVDQERSDIYVVFTMSLCALTLLEKLLLYRFKSYWY